MLAIFEGCSPEYTFRIHHLIDIHEIHVLSLVSDILNIPSVQESNNVRLSVLYWIILCCHDKKSYSRIQQIDAIVYWLHNLDRQSVGSTPLDTHPRRSLTIGSAENGDSHLLIMPVAEDNIEHLIDSLKVVCFFTF